MNPDTESAPPEATENKPRQPATMLTARNGIAFFVLLLIALLLAGRFLFASMQDELGRRVAESDRHAKEAQAIARQNGEALQALQNRLAALEAQLSEDQGKQLAIEAMYQELSKSRDDRLIAEVEQTVSIAAEQLQLAGNVEVALIALQGVDARLARASQPRFLAVRKLIARDIDRLRALPTADVPGMALKLESVITGVDAMPLAFEQRPPRNEPPKKVVASEARAPAVPPLWRRLASEAWGDLSQLVRVERIDGTALDPGLLSPSQTFFLRENLKLRLLNARLALLAHDGKSFREDMRQAHAWLERYFDNRAKPVQAALATVKALTATDVAVTPPSLDETLTALRKFKPPVEGSLPGPLKK